MGKQPQTLAQAIASLPEEERIILTMHYLKSMSAADIAAILGVPERSVEAIIRQGKARLSAILGMQPNLEFALRLILRDTYPLASHLAVPTI